MWNSIQRWVRRLRDPLARAEWAIQRLGLSVSEDPADAPGLVLIQIDGLARPVLEAAVKSGRMRLIGRLFGSEDWQLRNFYPGLPSTTPAVQAEILYGVRSGVPAFSFMNRATGEVTSMFNPDLVKEHEAEFARVGRGLLEGGSSWSNIYAGGAAPGESHFCLGSMGLSDIFQRGGLSARVFLSLLHIPSVVQILAMSAVELILGLAGVIIGIVRGRPLSTEFAAFLSRLCVGVGMRELVTIGASLDMARGHRIIHVNFLGYDEMAHLRGPSSAPALWMLGGIDRALERLFQAAASSPRRRYQVWVFSDHGQSPTDSLDLVFPGGFRKKLGECLRSPVAIRPQDHRLIIRRPWSFRQFQRRKRRTAARPIPGDRFKFAAMGPVGHLYVADELDSDERFSIARTLVAQARVPAVAFLVPPSGFAWVDTAGETTDPAAIMARWELRSDAARREVLEDLRGLLSNENAGDFVLFGHSGSGPSFAFSAESGSHGGLGLQETHGFVLAPSSAMFDETASGIRPGALRAAALQFIGRDATDLPRILEIDANACQLPDGRTTPRQLARWIQEVEPDIAIVRGLAESKPAKPGGLQASWIATLLGWHVFSSGHAAPVGILSRYPIEAGDCDDAMLAANISFRSRTIAIRVPDDEPAVAELDGRFLPIDRRVFAGTGFVPSPDVYKERSSTGTGGGAAVNLTSLRLRPDS